MKNYKKPMAVEVADVNEGVYLASGDTEPGNGGTGCESQYMKGVYKKGDSSGSGMAPAYDRKGCEGCAADDGDGCKLLKGDPKVVGNKYKPTWEQLGKTPDELVW